MKLIKKYCLLWLFAAFILFFAVADLFVPGREFSEMENRYLEQRPKFSLSKLLNNEYTPKYEKFVNDQFVGRDGWITLKSVCESALGKIENNGIVYGKDHYLFESYPSTNDDRIQKNIGFVNEFLSTLSPDTKATVALIPNSYAILQDLVPVGLQNVDQRSYIPEILSQIQGADTLDLTPVMDAAAASARERSAQREANQEETLAYYRTDHHWTTYGAYEGYRAFVESRGLKAVTLEELEDKLLYVPEFYGSYYNKCKLFSAVPDTIWVYDIPFSSITINGEKKDSLHDPDKWNTHDKHAAFLWGNNGLTIIQSQNNLNHQEGKTSRVLVVKDSYGNSFSAFLTYSYDEVWVVDLRDVAKMSDIMSQAQFDDLLILYNFMNFASDTNIPKLNY